MIDKDLFDPAELSGDADWALRVRGDSMAPTLRAGDVLYVAERTEAKDGEIVIAKIGEEMTVKRLVSGELRCDNPDYSPIAGGFQVFGVVTALMRRVACS